MTKDIPLVSKDRLYDPQQLGASIQLDSPAWFTWLDAPSTTRFSYALYNQAHGYIDGFMTVRKEQRSRGGAYWSVYRRQHLRLRKIYIGPSTALTIDRLQQMAARLYHPPTTAPP